jgi:hypothetical protein
MLDSNVCYPSSSSSSSSGGTDCYLGRAIHEHEHVAPKQRWSIDPNGGFRKQSGGAEAGRHNIRHRDIAVADQGLDIWLELGVQYYWSGWTCPARLGVFGFMCRRDAQSCVSGKQKRLHLHLLV